MGKNGKLVLNDQKQRSKGDFFSPPPGVHQPSPPKNFSSSKSGNFRPPSLKLMKANQMGKHPDPFVGFNV